MKKREAKIDQQECNCDQSLRLQAKLERVREWFEEVVVEEIHPDGTVLRMLDASPAEIYELTTILNDESGE